MTANASKYIYMPKSAEEIEKTKSDFYEIAPFPGIVGCVDGAHISIIVTK